MTDLARLDETARREYQREVIRFLGEPQRVDAAYGAEFAAAGIQEQLDIICTTAKQLLNTEGAELNIVTADKQITVAAAAEEKQEFLVESGYCQYVVKEKAPFGVESSIEHSLVCMSDATVHGGIRSYLGIPVIYRDQYVGALCVWNTHDTKWTTAHVSSLVYMAGVVMSLLDAQ